MGASKRVAEMIIQVINRESQTKFMAVRFGNVLGSHGSYLANYYARREDLSNLKRIVNLSLKKKSSEVAVLNVLFDLYMKNSEYDKAVETMLKSIDYIGRSGYVEQYKKIRANFKGENLKLIERKLLETARKKNLREYLDICLENVGSIYRLLEETGIMEVKRFKEKEVLV